MSADIVAIRKPPSQLAGHLRELADRAERGELTDLCAAYRAGGRAEFLYAASLSECLVLSTMLQSNAIERMRV